MALSRASGPSGLSTPSNDLRNSPSGVGKAQGSRFRRQDGLEVVVPPVRRTRDYMEFPEAYHVREVLRTHGSLSGECCYTARLGNEELVDNGRLALNSFQTVTSTRLSSGKREASKASTPASYDSDEMSLSHQRQQRAKRVQAAGYVNSSTLQLSSDEDHSTRAKYSNSRRSRLRRRGSLQASRGPKRSHSAAASDSEDDIASSDIHAAKRSSRHQTSRTTRSNGNRSLVQLRFRKKRADDSEDEDGIPDARRSSSEESLSYVISDRYPPSKEDRSKKRKRTASRRDYGSSRIRKGIFAVEDRLPAEGTRRSGRVGRATQSMKERGEDEINAVEEDGNTALAPRAVGASEKFKELPRKNEFRLVHSQTCDACGDYGSSAIRGQLIYCQGCILAYHKTCLGNRNGREHLVTKVANDDFVLQCRRCIRFANKKDPTAPRQDTCQVCKESGPACAAFRERKTAKQEEKDREDNDGQDPVTEVNQDLINNVHNILFRCFICRRAFHFSHLPPRLDNNNVSDKASTIEDMRFMQYCKDWSCLDCVDAPGKIQTLVAWRPTNLDTYIPGYTVEMVNDDEKEYLVKWEQLSYFRAVWMPGAWVWGVSATAMRRAFARRENGYNLPKMSAEEAIPEEYLRVDILLDVRFTSIVSIHTEEIDKARAREVDRALIKYKGLGYEDAVWETVPDADDGERWADFVAAYEDWVLGRYVHLPKQHYLRERLEKVRAMDFKGKLVKKKQPDTLVGGKLMDYQLDGLNWLLYKWYKSQNAILADEMGLGKTIQIIGLLATLVQDHKCWPFLIVVPNSTCLNWRREIKRWAPSLRVVAYYGSSEARKLAMKYELYPQGQKDLRCHIVVTSYEVPADDSGRRFLKDVPWAGLIVDEGQRLKNDKNLLYEALSSLKVPFRVLLTGTPLQNNARELFNLLQFLDKAINANQLEQDFSILSPEKVSELHELIRPFFLRRTKAQVLTFLPPMAQIIIPVTMTVLQKKLYKSILAKNPELIKAIFGKEKQQLKQADRSNLNNLLMQLRKCLCHPFVYSKLIEERSANSAVSHRSLVEASPKLQLLELMLPQLRDRGHRVLIFSQFLEMLDIVEDFLDGLEMPFQRLDGSIGSLQKQKRIDAFNAPGSPFFAFLLSTRAGGVGINLASADTVIIMDPDFNPHQDIQALSRAHRIGQKKKVLVFQLMTRDSAEEKIIQIGRKKMALDHVLIDKMDAEDDSGVDLQSILQHGTAALFDDNAERDIHYDVASVEKLLDRSQAENTRTGNDDSAESQFSFARVWANDQDELQDGLTETDTESKTPDPTIWDKILKERERDAAKQRAAAQETLGRGKRKRQAVNYAKENVDGLEQHVSSPHRVAQDSGSDTDFRERAAEDEEETDEEPQESEVRADELIDTKERTVRGIAASNGVATPERLSQKFQVTPKKFERAQIPKQPSLNGAGSSMAPNQDSNQFTVCAACNDVHAIGYCPLKIAGHEKCPLCGIAHYGAGRQCPHLKSEMQVRAMMEALKQSPEDKGLRDAAMTYLRGVKGSLILSKKRAGQKKLEEDAKAKTAAKTGIASTAGGAISADGAGSAGTNIKSKHFPPAKAKEKGKTKDQ